MPLIELLSVFIVLLQCITIGILAYNITKKGVFLSRLFVFFVFGFSLLLIGFHLGLLYYFVEKATFDNFFLSGLMFVNYFLRINVTLGFVSFMLFLANVILFMLPKSRGRFSWKNTNE